MENVVVACMQPRFGIVESQEAFAALARRFLRQAQAKSAQLAVFPELTGLMLAPPLISGLKLGLAKQVDRGRQAGAGFVARRVGRLAGATSGVLGGGLVGSLKRLLAKNGDTLRQGYLDAFGALAREFGTALLAGSLYLYDEETGSVRNRAYLLDATGSVLGWQDKLHLSADERELAVPGSALPVFQMKFGLMGILIGQDALYPELARLLVLQGADLIAGIAACPGAAQANLVRTALALRAEENQVYSAASFLLGSNFLDRADGEEYVGQSALLAPAALSERGDGILIQVGSSRREGAIVTTLEARALQELRLNARFRPRAEMNLAGLGPMLADFYSRNLTLAEAIQERQAGAAERTPASPPVEILEEAASDPSDARPAPGSSGAEAQE